MRDFSQEDTDFTRIRRSGSGEILYKTRANTLEGADLQGLDLAQAFLQNAQMPHAYLSGANMSGAYATGACLKKADLQDANLNGSNFEDASLYNASLYGTSLLDANLRGADLRYAFLCSANFLGARLDRARLLETDLSDTFFSRTSLAGADLSGAMFSDTVFANCPSLSKAHGLDQIKHYGPSVLDARTLRACIHDLPDVFLEGCGYTQHEIGYLRALYKDSPIAMYSCFISHAEADLSFATRLLADLRQANVTCWHYKDSLRGGQDWQPQIDEAIKIYDKLILVCSRQSVYRENVVKEILRAIEVERQTGEQKLFPIMLDHHILGPEMMEEAREMVTTRVWRENWVLHIKRKHIPDFGGWDKDNEKYAQEFSNLLRDLRRSS